MSAKPTFSEEIVAKVAHLARLELKPADLPPYHEGLSRILAWIEQMAAIDTQGIEPMAHPFDLAQPLREDKVTEADPEGKQQRKFQALAPAIAAGLYLVPKVIE